MREFHTGQLVVLTLDSPGPVGITDGLRHYQDRIFRISRAKTFQSSNVTTRGTYYELKGCVSDKGIPYAVTMDWIRPIREPKR
jgi:hypothetical protein